MVQIPSSNEAMRQYHQLGGNLKQFSTFGIDPLLNFVELQVSRRDRFYERFTSDENIFTDVLKGGSLLKHSILYFIELSNP